MILTWRPAKALCLGAAFGAIWDLALRDLFQQTGLTEGIMGPLILSCIALILVSPIVGLELLRLRPAPRPWFLLPFVLIALCLWLWATLAMQSALILGLLWPALLGGAGLWAALERWRGTDLAASAAARGWTGHRTRGALALIGFLIWKSGATLALWAAH